VRQTDTFLPRFKKERSISIFKSMGKFSGIFSLLILEERVS
jgi:hypothetical protein